MLIPMLIPFLLLCFFSNADGQFDFKDLINSNTSVENTDLTKLLLHLVLEMKLEQQKFVTKDEVASFIGNTTPSSKNTNEATDDGRSGSSFINKQYRTQNLPSTTEAPVVPADIMSTTDQILKLFVRRSCFDWRVSGFTTSGIYSIDPDGQGVGDPPLMVYCDMITGFTFVRHNMEGERTTTQCTGSMCYKANLGYKTSETQIETLIRISQSCQQFIKVDCFESPFQIDEEPLAYWKGRDGLEHYEWAGEGYPGHNCTCGLSESCVNPMKSCNCDAGIPNIWVSDSGYVTNHSALPIKEVAFGTKDQHTPLQVKYSIGPLRCYGSRSLTYPTSCLDIFLRGSARSGWYILGKPESLHFTYCNMDFVQSLNTEQKSSLEHQVKQPESADVELEDLMLRRLRSKEFVILRKEQLDEIQRTAVEQQRNITLIQDLLKSNEQQLVNHSLTLGALSELNAPRINVAFHADSHLSWTSPIVIRYELVAFNQGDVYDSGTGKFTAPVRGVYYITAYGRKNNKSSTYFVIQKNGEKINIAQSLAEQYTSLATAVVVHLEVGDEIEVYLETGKLYSSNYKGTSFMGFLLYEA